MCTFKIFFYPNYLRWVTWAYICRCRPMVLMDTSWMWCMSSILPSLFPFTLQPSQYPWVLLGEVTRTSCSPVPLHQLIHSTPPSRAPCLSQLHGEDNRAGPPPPPPYMVRSCCSLLCTQTLAMIMAGCCCFRPDLITCVLPSAADDTLLTLPSVSLPRWQQGLARCFLKACQVCNGL